VDEVASEEPVVEETVDDAINNAVVEDIAE